MCIAEIPYLIYYAYIPAIIIGIGFGIFVYYQSKKSLIHRALFAITTLFSFYLAIDFATWFPISRELYLLSQRVLMILIIILPLLVSFGYYLSGKSISVRVHLFLWVPIIPFIIISFSSWSNLLFYITKVDGNCLIESGDYYWIIYLASIIYLTWFLVILIKSFYLFRNNKIERRKITVVFSGAFFFVAWLVTMLKLVDYFGESALLFVPLGVVFFVGTLVYAITKYSLFNIKLIATQSLTYIIWILIGSQLFFVESIVNIVLIIITLILSIIFGIILIKSVQAEILRKDELEKLSAELARANKKLTKLDVVKSEFISIASHQLRTPLTAIKGFVSMLMEGSFGKISGDTEQALGKVYVSNERMINLVEDMLNVSRIEAGKMNYTFESVQLAKIIKELSDTFSIAAREKGLDLIISLPKKELPAVWADRIKIREVISNLIDNAVKYTKKGKVTVRAQQIRGRVRVTVMDSGMGITEEEIGRLFAKFVRGKDSSKSFANGTGLGLYMGRKIVEAHHGKIWVESKGKDKGSRFIVELSSGKPDKKNSSASGEAKA